MRILYLNYTLLLLFLFSGIAQGQLYYQDNFSSSNWKRNYDMGSGQNFRHISKGGPGNNGCVEITIPKGSHKGGSARYMLKEKLGFEPEELYAEYKVRYGKDMKAYGGKGPGFSGTYDRSGWGNRPGYGKAGWSARGQVNCDNQPYTTNGWYVYHTYTNYDAGNCPGSTNYRKCNPFPYDISNPGRQPHASKKTWGSVLKWGNKGNMQFDKWYSVKQYIKLNTPGRNNGILRVWVDGKLANEFKNMNFRRTRDLKIYAYWFNYYNGGSNTIRSTGHVRIDDFKLYGPNGPGADPGNNNPAVKVTGVQLSLSKLEMDKGAKKPLSAKISPSNASDKSVKWSSSNTNVATVSSDGLVTAVNAGKAAITATTKDGGKTSRSEVTVKSGSGGPSKGIGLPGTFEAEAFSSKSGNLRIENTPSSSGKNIGFVKNGDHLEYAVDVAFNGSYTFEFMAAGNSGGGTIDVLENGSKKGSLVIKSTGGWHSYKKYTLKNVSLSVGSKKLKLAFKGKGDFLFNLDKVSVKGTPPSPTKKKTATMTAIQDAFMQGTTRYDKDVVRIEQDQRIGYLMFDLSSIKGSITKAELKFTIASDAGKGKVNIYQGNGDQWTEKTLSNSNKPKTGTLMGSIEDNFKIGETKTVSLKSNAIKTGGKLSLLVSAQSGNDFAFGSKEGKAAKPSLVITYSSTSGRENSREIELVEASQPVVYTDPITHQLMVNFPNDHNYYYLQVINVHGQTVYSSAVDGKDTAAEIDLRKVRSGVYFVQMIGKDGKDNVRVFNKK